jgi:Holliday junction DNA helicase RuvA
VREALAGLGYGPDEIRTATADLPDAADAAALLREALQRLASTR